MTLQTFISFAQAAFNAMLGVGKAFQIPIRQLVANGAYGFGTILNTLIKTLDFFGQTWLGNMSIFTLLFSEATLIFIIIAGLIRWILDILP